MNKSLPQETPQSPLLNHYNKILSPKYCPQDSKENFKPLEIRNENILRIDKPKVPNIFKSSSRRASILTSTKPNNHSFSMPNHIIPSLIQSENSDIAEKENILSPLTKIQNSNRFYSKNSKTPSSLTIISEFKSPNQSNNQLLGVDECEDYISFRSGRGTPQEGFANPPRTSDFSTHSHKNKYLNFGTLENMTPETENIMAESQTTFLSNADNETYSANFIINTPTRHQYSLMNKSQIKNYQPEQKANSQPPKSNKEYDNDETAQEINLEIQNVLLNSTNRSQILKSRELLCNETIKSIKSGLNTSYIYDEKLKAKIENNKFEKQILKSQIIQQIDIKNFVKSGFKHVFV